MSRRLDFRSSKLLTSLSLRVSKMPLSFGTQLGLNSRCSLALSKRTSRSLRNSVMKVLAASRS